MQNRRGTLVVLILAVVLTGSLMTVGPAQADGTGEFLVIYADGVEGRVARAAIAAAGGTLIDETPELGLAQIVTNDAAFTARVMASGAAQAVVRNHSIGTSVPGMPHRFADERALEDRSAYRQSAGSDPDGVTNGPKNKKSGPETFSWLQWDMEMIGATADEGHQVATGEGVLVGIIDTGIDGSHPDLAPNFNAALSENFTTDIPAIDGPCEAEPDQSCSDPANVDEGGHGTHVAGIVAAAYNGLGIAGVAPDATLVNLRAGQDSGFFFVEETVDAIVASANKGLDVVNMSFFTDPWLYNCDSPDDYVEGEVTAQELAEQAAIRELVAEAVEYARDNGVTLVAAAGNQHNDLAAPTRLDTISPDYPPGIEQERVVTNDCLTMPSEAPGVIQVSSLGPSTIKADYSVWGLGSIDVSAPGGWFRDYFGTQDFRDPENMILSTYPLEVAREEGAVNKGDHISDPHFYKQDCEGNDCATYQYLQGTSMASPHVAGVVALIIEAYGVLDGSGGYSLAPDTVYEILTATASDTPCPDPALLDYTQEGRPASWNATCTGSAEYNSNYGHGIVHAPAAID